MRIKHKGLHRRKEEGNVALFAIVIMMVLSLFAVTFLSSAGANKASVYMSYEKLQSKRAADYALKKTIQADESLVLNNRKLPASGIMGDDNHYQVTWESTVDNRAVSQSAGVVQSTMSAQSITAQNAPSNGNQGNGQNTTLQPIAVYSMHPYGNASWSEVGSIDGGNIALAEVSGDYNSALESQDYSIVGPGISDNAIFRSQLINGTDLRPQESLPIDNSQTAQFDSFSYFNQNLNTVNDLYIMADPSLSSSGTDLRIYSYLEGSGIDPKLVYTGTVPVSFDAMSVTGYFSSSLLTGVALITVEHDGITEIYQYNQASNTVTSILKLNQSAQTLSTSAVWNPLINNYQLFIGYTDTEGNLNVYEYVGGTKNPFLVGDSTSLQAPVAGLFTVGATYDSQLQVSVLYLVYLENDANSLYSTYRLYTDSNGKWEHVTDQQLTYSGAVKLKGIYSDKFSYALINYPSVKLSKSEQKDTITATAVGRVFRKDAAGNLQLAAQTSIDATIVISYSKTESGSLVVGSVNVSNVSIK